MKQTASHILQNVTEILQYRKDNKLDVLRKRAHCVCFNYMQWDVKYHTRLRSNMAFAPYFHIK